MRRNETSMHVNSESSYKQVPGLNIIPNQGCTDCIRSETEHRLVKSWLEREKDIDPVPESSSKKLRERKKIHLPSAVHRIRWERMDR